MNIAASFALLGTVFLSCCGNIEAYIGFEDDLTPADNCSEAYIQLQQKHFGCINGSLAYCSRGRENEDDHDITLVYCNTKHLRDDLSA